MKYEGSILRNLLTLLSWILLPGTINVTQLYYLLLVIGLRKVPSKLKILSQDTSEFCTYEDSGSSISTAPGDGVGGSCAFGSCFLFFLFVRVENNG